MTRKDMNWKVKPEAKERKSKVRDFGVSVAPGAAAQPSDTGGDTQPYFSWVFTRDLKVASASLRLKAFLDFPGFLHIRPWGGGEPDGRKK